MLDVNHLSCILDDPCGDVESLPHPLLEALDKPK
jgi:hypothetical protein